MSHTPYDDFELVRKVVDGYWPATGPDPRVPEARAALDRLEQVLFELLHEVVQLRSGEDGNHTSVDDLLVEYRRLYRIEDAAKALLVGRLRDVPEEGMASLWSDLVKAADASSPL